MKRVESSSESSSGEEDELDGENNSDEDQTSSSCSESGEISKSGEAQEKGKPRATTSVKKSSKKRKASKNFLSEEEVEEQCERLESKQHDLDCEIARKLKSSPNLAFYPSRAALKEAILGDKKVLNEITDEFVNEFIGVIHDVIYDLLHFTGQDFTAAQRERAQEDFNVLFKSAPPHPPSHSHTKDSHSTGITLLFSNSAWVLLRLTELSTFKEL